MINCIIFPTEKVNEMNCKSNEECSWKKGDKCSFNGMCNQQIVFPKNFEILNQKRQMKHSQINQPKGWGFSRRTPNLNLSLLRGRLSPKGIRGVMRYRETPKSCKFLTYWRNLQWLNTNTHTSTQRPTDSMLRLQEKD